MNQNTFCCKKPAPRLNEFTHSQYDKTMNRHTIDPMKRDTYTVPRQRSRAWQWLAALMMAVFAVGSTSSASATSFNPRPFDVAHISAQSGCGAANAIVENGETITVTFGLTNKLSGNTLALVATLQS
ncbi:MAG: hypothetical protein FJ404_11555, partial [Verrucomicrobia bacterium]|nr:hypothetical protein [Verrucomicrobiota bacterium]